VVAGDFFRCDFKPGCATNAATFSKGPLHKALMVEPDGGLAPSAIYNPPQSHPCRHRPESHTLARWALGRASARA